MVTHSADPPKTSAPLKLPWHVAQAVLWFALWIALDHVSQVADLVLGAACAVAMTALVAWVSLLTGARFGGRPAWIRRVAPVIPAILRDNVTVLGTLFTGKYRGRGHVFRIPFDPGRNSARDAGRRSLVVAAVSATPNTAVIAASRTDDAIYVHTLVVPADQPGGGDPRWPI
jgi:multisubunit Na+/H+ antiporter MnhE subunit